MSLGPSIVVHVQPTERRGFFHDEDGVLTTGKAYNDKLLYRFDLGQGDSGVLATGETISTATWTSEGPTLTSAALATGMDGANTAYEVVVTGTGEARVVVVTSAGRQWETRYRWRDTDKPTIKDYNS